MPSFSGAGKRWSTTGQRITRSLGTPAAKGIRPQSISLAEVGDTKFNPRLAADDTAMGDQARALVALHRSNKHYRPILDRVAAAAYTALHSAATYAQAGVDAGNGWRRQPGAGLWGSDWFGRAIAAVMYI